MTTDQKDTAQTYRWVCNCGHAYSTTADMPGECPLHLAAPDLLATLKALRDLLTDNPDVRVVARNFGDIAADNLFREADAAIAKAEAAR